MQRTKIEEMQQQIEQLQHENEKLDAQLAHYIVITNDLQEAMNIMIQNVRELTLGYLQFTDLVEEMNVVYADLRAELDAYKQIESEDDDESELY